VSDVTTAWHVTCRHEAHHQTPRSRCEHDCKSTRRAAIGDDSAECRRVAGITGPSTVSIHQHQISSNHIKSRRPGNPPPRITMSVSTRYVCCAYPQSHCAVRPGVNVAAAFGSQRSFASCNTCQQGLMVGLCPFLQSSEWAGVSGCRWEGVFQ
jgi:hypothetical protein